MFVVTGRGGSLAITILYYYYYYYRITSEREACNAPCDQSNYYYSASFTHYYSCERGAADRQTNKRARRDDDDDVIFFCYTRTYALYCYFVTTIRPFSKRTTRRRRHGRRSMKPFLFVDARPFAEFNELIVLCPL